MNVMAGDRIRDPSAELFVVVDVAGSVAIVSRTQVLHSLDGWEIVQRVSETGEVERLTAEVVELKAKLEAMQ